MSVTSQIRDAQKIADVQHRLLELGYVGAGPIDGEMGKKTEATILNFRNRNGLPLVPYIDEELVAALATAPKISLPPAQVTATVKDIAPKVEAVQKTWWAKAWAWILGLPSAVFTVIVGIINSLGDAIERLTPLKDLLGESLTKLPPVTMILVGTTLTTAVSFLIWWQTKRAEDALVDGYQRGTVRNDNVQEKATEEHKEGADRQREGANHALDS